MRKYAGWLTLSVFAYVAWLLVTLPMAPVLRAAGEAGIPLRLSGVSGGLWSGQASRLETRGLYLGDVRWEFAALALLRGRLAFDLEFRDPGGAGIARLALGGGGRVALENLSGKLEAGRVAPLLPLSPGLSGDLVFDDVSLQLREGRPESARGQVRWLQAALSRPFPLEIGVVNLEFPDAGPGLQGVYSGGGDAFTIEGTLTVDAGQGYRTDTLITPLNQEVRGWLQGLGLSRAGSAYRAVYTGNW